VKRSNEQALITLDRMRIDVLTEFYVRVQPTAEAIASAAQTLGQRTMLARDAQGADRGKFVDSLRSVAAEMTMEDLHVQRVKFVQRVQAQLYAVDAQGRRALHEADNVSTEQIAMQIRIAIIKALPQTIAESVRPLENIDGIKIVQVDGLTGGSSHGAGTNGGGLRQSHRPAGHQRAALSRAGARARFAAARDRARRHDPARPRAQHGRRARSGRQRRRQAAVNAREQR